jgi:PAS domain S-box-containing protein
MLAPGVAMTAELEDLKAIWLELRAHVDQLAGERQHYLDFFEQSPEAYVVTDVQGTIVDANGAAVDILQRRRQTLRGKPIAALVALDRRTEFRGHLRRLAARESGARQSWTTVFEAPELRTEVSLSARVIERGHGAGGICWLLRAAP